MSYEDYKKEIESIVIDRFDNLDLGKVDMMLNVMDYKIRRHFNNGRTPKQALGYINWNILFVSCF